MDSLLALCKQWRSKGGDRAVRPGRHFLGGGKIDAMPKNLERVKVFWGKILERVYKRAVNERKIERVKKRSSKKYWGMRRKSRGAANLRSAPGGRHPSYATVCKYK